MTRSLLPLMAVSVAMMAIAFLLAPTVAATDDNAYAYYDSCHYGTLPSRTRAQCEESES